MALSSALPSLFCGIEWADRPVMHSEGGDSVTTEVLVVLVALVLIRVAVSTKDSEEFLTIVG